MVISGRKIKKYRELRDFSQEYVADSLGISQTAYSKIESDQTKLSARRLSKLAEIFQISESDFFESDRSVNFNDNSVNYGNGYVNNLIEGQKEVFESTIKTLENQIERLNAENKELLEIIKSQYKSK